MRIGQMLDDVHEQHNVERVVGKRKLPKVEIVLRVSHRAAHLTRVENVHAVHPGARDSAQHFAGYVANSAAEVQKVRFAGNPGKEAVAHIAPMHL